METCTVTQRYDVLTDRDFNARGQPNRRIGTGHCIDFAREKRYDVLTDRAHGNRGQSKRFPYGVFVQGKSKPLKPKLQACSSFAIFSPILNFV